MQQDYQKLYDQNLKNRMIIEKQNETIARQNEMLGQRRSMPMITVPLGRVVTPDGKIEGEGRSSGAVTVESGARAPRDRSAR